MKLDHIGLVVENISEFSEILRDLGLEQMTHTEVEPIQKVSGRFVLAGEGQEVYIELLEPLGEESPIRNFLAKRGGGLHHLCFEVDDIDSAARQLVERGLDMVCEPVEAVGYDRTFRRTCSESTRIAFFLAGNALLIELVEKGE